jgi:phosphatidylglycerophosphate synthase
VNAIVLADSPLAAVSIAGVSARERARRVALRAGARSVRVVADRRTLADEDLPTGPLLVVWADRLVHPPLVAALATDRDGITIVVDERQRLAGAALISEAAQKAALAALAAGDDDAFAAQASTRVVCGDLAQHPIATAADRAGAHAMLYRMIVKPQDNVITRYLFRPVSARVTRLLVLTPITPTQVSLVVAVLVALGCWMTLDARPSMMIGGALVILAASYLDCCDGEIARIKLQSSTFGAWLDTIIDEASSIGYMVAIGWHCHVYYGRNYFGDLGFDPWLVGIVVGLVTFGLSLVGIYYNIIVAVGSGNSQDYVSRFDIIERCEAWRLQPRPSKAVALPAWFEPIARFLPNIVRRDFIVWLATIYAIARVPHVSFATHLAGGVTSIVVVAIDHLHLRALQRRARRAGKRLERVRSS